MPACRQEGLGKAVLDEEPRRFVAQGPGKGIVLEQQVPEDWVPEEVRIESAEGGGLAEVLERTSQQHTASVLPQEYPAASRGLLILG